jgi:tetratricopeptide (TPR) repeat protein
MSIRDSALIAVLLQLVLPCHHVIAQERTDFPSEAREEYERGKELQKKGLLEQALGAFEEAIKLGMEDFPRVHLGRASSNLELRNYDAAIAQYTRFIEQFGLERSCRY